MIPRVFSGYTNFLGNSKFSYIQNSQKQSLFKMQASLHLIVPRIQYTNVINNKMVNGYEKFAEMRLHRYEKSLIMLLSQIFSSKNLSKLSDQVMKDEIQ